MFKKNKEKEKNKTLYKHFLSCSKCAFKFSIEHEENSNVKIGLDRMSCPVCRKPIQLDASMLNISGKPSMEQQSRMNAEASRDAQKIAFERKRMDQEEGENKRVLITSTQKGSAGQTEMIPEKVIKSIEEKISPEINE